MIDFLGPSALKYAVVGETPTLLCFSKSSKMLSPVAVRVLSKIQNAKDGLGLPIFYILFHMDLHNFFQSAFYYPLTWCLISAFSKVSQELMAIVCSSYLVWNIMQYPSAKSTIISPKNKHHTVQ